MRSVFVCIFALSAFSTSAQADAQSYCEVLGKDFANEKTNNVDAWLSSYRNAYSDCMAQYTAEAKVGVPDQKTQKKVAEKVMPKVIVAPAKDFSKKKSTPMLEPGSVAWNKYCAAKYVSFNEVTGTYKSYGGKQKPCLTPD